MQSAPTRAIKSAPQPGQRRRARRGLRRATAIIAGLITLAVLGLMALTLLGIWPPKTTEAQPEATVKQTSAFAKGLVIEKNGNLSTDQSGQLIVPLKATNNIKQPPKPEGTPTPGAPTPVPGPAKVLSASVKVLFYKLSSDGKTKQVIGTAYGGFDAAPNGLQPGQTMPFQVYATGVDKNAVQDYEAFTDLVHTDQDVIKKEDAQPTSPVQSPTAIPLGTTSPQGNTAP